MYEDYSLWHHSLMTYLQLCTRYPNFRESKEAAISIAPDVSTLPPSALEAALVERALQSHWDSFRVYLMEEGGLLRSAVRAFAGVGAKTRPMDLMLICDDTQVVLKALKKSLKEPSGELSLVRTWSTELTCLIHRRADPPLRSSRLRSS